MKKKYRYFKLSYFLRKLYSYKFLNFFLSENFIRKKIFKHIFESGYWLDYDTHKNQSRSGKGSNFENTLQLQNNLKVFFKENKVRKILDIGCGDFNWMSILLKEIDYESYIGLDIVSSLVDHNNQKYGTEKIKFITKDFVNDDLDFFNEFDFILIRHVFIHLKNSNINNIIDKVKKINFRYLGITSDPNLINNLDLKTEGRYRDINLSIKPFCLEKPLQILNDIDTSRVSNVDLNIYNLK
ncbi:class I SAM-dependent methyltransferase [Candidatus Pelagibacter sp.]|nr:class I SAM-dependent methyltransferase [Candidatus Pelagibacter sp.]